MPTPITAAAAVISNDARARAPLALRAALARIHGSAVVGTRLSLGARTGPHPATHRPARHAHRGVPYRVPHHDACRLPAGDRVKSVQTAAPREPRGIDLQTNNSAQTQPIKHDYR